MSNNIPSEECRKKFLILRKNVRRRIEKADFLEKDDVIIDCFNDVCLESTKNDPIAQDYLSYIFKKGLENVIPSNYEKFMQFEILAAANGNNFALEKLALFLNYPLNEISYQEDFEYLVSKHNLTSQNYLYIVGKLICEGIIDEMQLDPQNLVKEDLAFVDFSPKLMRKFDKARNSAIPKVLNFLRFD